MYCFCKYRLVNDGSGAKEPDLPVTAEYATLCSGENDEWCLCEVTFEEEPKEIERISNELQILLDSSKCYPPALALALHQANKDLPTSKRDCSTLLVKLLGKYLKNQQKDSFFLVESAKEELGYRDKGEFVWIIRYYPETKEVLWVSSDFFLYRNSVTDFIASTDNLQKVAM